MQPPASRRKTRHPVSARPPAPCCAGPWSLTPDLQLQEREFGWDARHHMIFVDQVGGWGQRGMLASILVSQILT